MADIPKIYSSPPQSTTSPHHELEQDDPIQSQQTLNDSNTNCSSFLEDDHHRDHQVSSNSCPSCSSEPESESHYPDSTVYPDYPESDDDYNLLDFQTAHESGRLSNEFHDDDFVSNNNIQNLGLGLVARIESESDTEALTSDHTVDEVINRIEVISVSSDISSEGESGIGVLEWEILVAGNNFEQDLEFANDLDFDTLIGQFVDNVRAFRGSPPAAKSFIDSLLMVGLRKGDLNEYDIVMCAVCKDEILMEESVTKLPCKHYYHGECIVPWLSIRNTCPVCRFELPTDDVDYERSKNRVNDGGGDELLVGYGFHHSP